jgi:hypothetical protein
MAQPPGIETRASPEPRHEGRDDPEARPHAGNEFVRGGGVDHLAGGEAQGLPGFEALARALAGDRVVDAVVPEDAEQELHVGEARHVDELQRLLREKARRSSGAGRRSWRRRSG